MSGYRNAHNAVKRRFGPASLHVCVWCGGEAEQWAYTYSSADEQRDPDSGPYSLDPLDYQPMCRRDHTTLDNLVRRNAPPQHFANAAIAAYRRRPLLSKMVFALSRAGARLEYAAATGKTFEVWEAAQ